MTYTPVYCSTTSVYNKSGLSATEVDLSTKDDIIQDAELELESLTGRKWTSAVAKTEYINGHAKDIIGTSGNSQTTINLSCYPIRSITSFLILNTDGTTQTDLGALTSALISAGTFYTTNYVLSVMDDYLTNETVAYGKITLKQTVFPEGTQNIKIAYTYGYTTVPTQIRDLASCLAGIRAWVSFLGGSYNRLDSYSIPQQNVSKGDFYARGKQMVEHLKEEADKILDLVGKRQRVLFVCGGTK